MMSVIVTAVVQLSQPFFCFAVSSSSFRDPMFMLAGTPSVTTVPETRATGTSSFGS